MRRNQKRQVALICLCVVVLAVILFFTADIKYRDYNRAEYVDEMSYYSKCIEEEKAWIAAQQSQEGYIFLYESKDHNEGSVVPYFSCKTALGLLAGETDQDDLQLVAEYLSWHTQELIKYQGNLCDYKVVQGELVPKDTYDSVDSYIALYLSLLATYANQGGSLKEIPQLEEAVTICVDRLKELTYRGLTKVSDTKGIYYTMDNLEVLEAYEKMDTLMNSQNPDVEKWKNKEELADFFSSSKEEIRRAIKSFLWNHDKDRFEVGLDEDFEFLDFENEDELYPHSIAQVQSIACDIHILDSEEEQRLYEELSEKHAWVTMKQDTTFEWPVLAYIAVELGDIESAEEYLNNLRSKYEKDRGYPFKSPDAGWAARTYAKLYDFYEEKANRGLMDMLLEKYRQ